MARDLRIGWLGFHREGAEPLAALVGAHPGAVVAVVTLAADLRAKRSGAHDFAPFCAAQGLPLHEVRNVNRPDAVALLSGLDLDVLFVIGWSQILSPEALAVARLGCIGAHASLLPRNRGSAPINWAVIKGETETGNSLIWLDPDVDAGSVIAQGPIEITPFDTCATLYDEVARLNTEMILDVVAALKRGETPGVPQAATDEAVLPRRHPDCGVIDWRWPARKVYDSVRAQTRPYPGAYGTLDGALWRIWRMALLPAGLGAARAPGTVIGPVVSPDEGACGQAVACGEGAVTLLEIEAEDGRILAGRALAEAPLADAKWRIEANELDIF